VVESGTHAELMARRGPYWRLMAPQLQAVARPDAALAASNTDPPGTTAAVAREAPATPARPPGARGDGGAQSSRRGVASDDGGSSGDADAERDTSAAEAGESATQAPDLRWPQALVVLARMIRGYRARLVTTFLLGMGRVAALIAVGLLGALVVRAAKQGTSFGALLLALALTAPLVGVLHWLESWLAHDMAYRLLSDMRLALFRTLDAISPAYLTRRRSGDLVAVATHDVELVEYFFAHTVTPVLVALLVPLAVLATLVGFGWPLAASLLPFLVYAALSPVLRRSRIDRLGARAREVAGELTAHTVDSIQGIGEIVAFQREHARGEELGVRARAYLAARTPFLADLAREAAVHEAMTGLGGVAVIVAGASLVATGALDAAMLPLLTLLALSAFIPLWEVAQVGRQLADTLGATRRVHAIHSEPVPVQDGPGVRLDAAVSSVATDDASEPAGAAPGSSKPSDSPRGTDALADRTAADLAGRRHPPASTPAPTPAIELRDVTFTYPGRRRPALVGVSLTVPAGSTVALVGASGAGKTTIAHLCLRFWDPQTGEVRLAGHDLRAWRLEDLRREIALVAQDTHLFNDTLRANVLLARPTATEAELGAALERASLGELVETLPDGLETTVGERGMQLSGGQRQRVAIARAFLKDAPVLLLDEATSHLDAVNEAVVRQALDALARGRTTLVIAHRLSTVRDADLIAVLHEGRIVETGRHDDLLASGRFYARLVSRQVAAVTVRAER
jgi:ATP-binding cassette subfamily C protein CydCD